MPLLISVLMPVYNAAPFLAEAVESILNQTFTDFELIISDNASSDRTQLICSEYISKDKRVRYIRQDENIGIYANFQFVLDEALGEYFMWIADDDKRSSDFLEEAVSLLESNHRCVAAVKTNIPIKDVTMTNKACQIFSIPIKSNS